MSLQVMKDKIDNIQKILTFFIRDWQTSNTSKIDTKIEAQEHEGFNTMIGKGPSESLDKKE